MMENNKSMSNSLKEALNNIGNKAATTATSVKNTVNNTSTNVSNILANTEKSIVDSTKSVSQSLQNFGSQTGTSIANAEFLSTNSIVAKTVFILLLLIVFLVLFKVGVFLMEYFFLPNQNPYVYGKGTIAGNTAFVISTNPNVSNHVQLPRSNNKSTGLEFTWSFWLSFTMSNISSGSPNVYHNIFNVGDAIYDTSTGISKVNNAPGVYMIQDTQQDTTNNNAFSGYAKLHILMDQESQSNTPTIDIDNLPYNKWFHVAIRLENTVMDVYINGLLTQRTTFDAVPKQNFYDVNICQNGGFNGYMSNLQYFSRALNVFDINSIIFWGPDLTPATVNGKSTNMSGLKTYDYLSSDWYFNKLGQMKF